MEKKIFTISREYGAGGLPVGHLIAEKLGIPFYDKKLVEHVAEESGFAPKFIEEHGEHAPSRSVFSYAFAPQGVPGVMNGLSTSDYLWNVQCSVILQLAEQGPCVIVGRNADYILKDRNDVFNVYLHASTPARIERILGDGVVTKDPEGLLAERDKYGANDVRPGLTGWAQIHGRDELEIAEKATLSCMPRTDFVI